MSSHSLPPSEKKEGKFDGGESFALPATIHVAPSLPPPPPFKAVALWCKPFRININCKETVENNKKTSSVLSKISHEKKMARGCDNTRKPRPSLARGPPRRPPQSACPPSSGCSPPPRRSWLLSARRCEAQPSPGRARTCRKGGCSARPARRGAGRPPGEKRSCGRPQRLPRGLSCHGMQGWDGWAPLTQPTAAVGVDTLLRELSPLSCLLGSHHKITRWSTGTKIKTQHSGYARR